jgi:hypothetical protein
MVTKLNPMWSHVDWYSFYIHLRSMNVRNFGMVEAAGLKVRRRSQPQWHDTPVEFREIY